MHKARFTEEQMVAIIRKGDRDPGSAVANRFTLARDSGLYYHFRTHSQITVRRMGTSRVWYKSLH